MPNIHDVDVPLDNFVQSGDTTLSELENEIALLNNGVKPGVANPIRDPATGKLVRVVLRVPETIAANAVSKINLNPGVPTTVVDCPPQMFADDLSDSTPDGIVYDQPLLSDGTHVIYGATVDGFLLGKLVNTGAGNAYTDLSELLSAGQFMVYILNDSLATDLTIATGDVLTFNFSATQAVVAALTADLTIPKRAIASPGFGNTVSLYLDVNGKLYLRQSVTDGVGGTRFTYEEACLQGAL
jgi:hypothetical protein